MEACELSLRNIFLGIKKKTPLSIKKEKYYQKLSTSAMVTLLAMFLFANVKENKKPRGEKLHIKAAFCECAEQDGL